MKITVQALVRAPLAIVWAAWSDPEAIWESVGLWAGGAPGRFAGPS